MIIALIAGPIFAGIAFALLCDRLKSRRDAETDAGLRLLEEHANGVDDESYFADLRFTDETWQQARREHGWCTCLRARSTSDDDRIPDPDCPVHQEIAR